jgi:hypothetical protein
VQRGFAWRLVVHRPPSQEAGRSSGLTASGLPLSLAHPVVRCRLSGGGLASYGRCLSKNWFVLFASVTRRAIASQTARATDDIARQVADIQASSRRTVQAIGEIVDTIGSMNEVTVGIADAIEQQGVAAQSIIGQIQTAAEEARGLAVTVEGVRAVADESGSAAEAMERRLDVMRRSAAQLQNEVSSLATSIRAA